MPSGACAFDANVNCPIWFGDAEGKDSLYHEALGEEGTHQSDRIGAWLAASVLFGVVVGSSPSVCYISETDLANVMPAITNIAFIPLGQGIYHLISEATRLALTGTYGTMPVCV